MKLADATQITTWLPPAVYTLGLLYVGGRCAVLGGYDGAVTAGVGIVAGTVLFGRTLNALRNVRAALTELMQIFTLKAEELSETATSFSSAANEQATAVAQIGSTTAELNQTGQATAEIAKRMVKSADEAVSTGEKGLTAVEEGVRVMSSVEEQTEKVAAHILKLSERNLEIDVIVESVSALAEQSNLLAVNASIEAAKAGESGLGFGVVASEVRELAERSKAATVEIRRILKEVQRTTHETVLASEENLKSVTRAQTTADGLRGAINELAQALTDTSERARQIGSVVTQQASGIAQINAAMEDMMRVGENAASGAENLQGSVEEMKAFAGRVRELVG